MIPNVEELKQVVGLSAAKKNNNIYNCIILQIMLPLYFKKPVTLSRLVLICNFF